MKAKRTTDALDFHPAAKHFPLMVDYQRKRILNVEENETWRRFVSDIRINGQREPILLVAGKILDGRNRYLACRSLEIPVSYVERKAKDVDALSLSLNLHRRHLTAGQVASVVCEQILPEERTKAAARKSAAGGDTTAPRSTARTAPAKATEAAAKRGGIGSRSVEQYETLTDESKAEVKAGKSSVSGAYASEKRDERDAAEKKDKVAKSNRLADEALAKLVAATEALDALGRVVTGAKHLPDHQAEKIVEQYAKLKSAVLALPLK